jgi:hypothetical protein
MKPKNKKKKFYKSKEFMTMFTLLVMVLSSFGFMWQGSKNRTHTYNGFRFHNEGNAWSIIINKNKLYFQDLPEDVVNVSFSVMKPINSQRIYGAYDPRDTTINYRYVMGVLADYLKVFNIVIQPACTTEEGCGNIPVVDCSSERTVIEFRKSNETGVYSDNNCIVISGKDIDHMNKAIERYVYQLYGIIK